MDAKKLYETASQKVQPNSDLVDWHLEFLRKMVSIDSRSFNVNEFAGDRTTPTDMKEILACAEDYLRQIGFPWIKINQPPPEYPDATPILLAEIPASPDKPTILFYAHLDKQPYMDDGRFQKWEGVPPTELRWNENRTRAYGRGAADDLSGVVSIGMTIDALLKSSPHALPCNIKVIYETEEECGSHSLAAQIRQNQEFFSSVDCVVITDVINPATGIPALTTSLRGIIQLEATLTGKDEHGDAQTALYKLLATLIHDDHALAVDAIAQSDHPETEEETRGYANVPTSIEMLRDAAGLLPETRLTVPEKKEALILAQLRKSCANVRPGHRLAGSIIFGAAGARLTFSSCKDDGALKNSLQSLLTQWNPFHLKLTLKQLSSQPGTAVFDLLLQSADKDPHSGMHGGPFPVPELQLAKMIGRLVHNDGSLHKDIASCLEANNGSMKTQSLRVEHDGTSRLFENPTAKAIVEIRLAPGNNDTQAIEHLINHLKKQVTSRFELGLKVDKGASPWMTECKHPVFPLVLESLEKGFGQPSCLYGCGGSIPFVAKLLDALGDVQPICLGAYDADARMHEPGESMSLVDLLGCTRSIIYLIAHAANVYPATKT
ncbi:MAG: M20/M25/M40 family metallo-hydrolase [Nitrospinae bacterium]|jgi:acetylornithine deacetylase/succinyl-diaminopimelate desuccinylase-like protein|nr:M20/M25/M40 family metallo-hydrolase [Nitrospinota bacterium]MDA1109539.1 M20/M25/M40 family metallo-hydrolase [Nitrospinota bacterium]